MLTDEQIQFFRDNGYLVIPELYNKDEMQEIKNWTDEVAAYPEVPGKYMMYFEQSLNEPGKRILNRIENLEPYHAGFARLFKDTKLQGAVEDLFGEKAALYKDKINFKKPGGDGFKAHQDVQAGWDKYALIHITALVSIDAATIANGCLEIAPGKHQSGLIGDKWQPLDEDALEYIPIETAPGDSIFFDSFIPHRSKPNMTGQERRVLYITYNKLSEGDHRQQYYDDKRKSYPPDCERQPGKEYVFRV